MRGSGTPSDSPNRGQSEVVGTILLLTITILVVGAVVGVAGSALDETRTTVEVQGVEQSLTLFDSRAALVALGKSPTQELSLGRVTRGHYTVNESAGWIEIRHLNYQGSAASGESELVLPRTNLGVVRYESGDTSIAYQGGGVWHATGQGAVMLSPPGYHYRGETLTFPLVRVTGQDSASGTVSTVIHERNISQPVYPSATNYNGSDPPDRQYRNPVRNGTIQLTVHSDYYQAWGQYFRERTTANVTVYDSNQTVVAKLITVGTRGRFGMPLQGNSIEVRGMEPHSMNDFNVTIYPDEDSADFANLEWSLYAEKPSGETLEYALYTDGGKLCKNDGTRTNSDLVSLVYYTSGGATYQGWTNRTTGFGTDGGIEIHCPSDGSSPYIVANFSGPTPFTYGTVPDNQLYASVDGSLKDPTNFEHDYVTWENDTDTTQKAVFTAGDTAPAGNLTDHYTANMGSTFDLTVRDRAKGKGSSGSVSESNSYGFLDYKTGERVVTYLHVTRNEIAVDLR